MTTSTSTDHKALCVHSIHLMGDGDLPDFEAVVHPDAINREGKDEPLASRGRGPAAFYATALWLREAFSDLHWDIHDVLQDGDLVSVHATMSGQQTGTFVAYGPDAKPVQAFPPTGRPFASTQSHWFRVLDGKVVEHWANRDDLGTATQLGWAPPSPVYAVTTMLATRRVKKAAAQRRR
jgi:predicted ester cyclase